MTVTILDYPDSQDEIEWLEQKAEERFLALRRYIVFGPLMEGGDWNDQACAHEPPERYRPYVELRAANAQAAKIEAIKDRQFEELVKEARWDERNPFSRVRAMPDCPEHECVIDAAMDDWDDEADPEGVNLPECDVCNSWNDGVQASTDRLDEKYPL